MRARAGAIAIRSSRRTRDGIEDCEYFKILERLDPKNPLLTVPPDVCVSETEYAEQAILKRQVATLTVGRTMGILMADDCASPVERIR